jgi:hypothetical protein
VYPDKTGALTSRDIGVVFASGRRSPEEHRTLRDVHYQAGDFFDVAVHAPAGANPAALPGGLPSTFK